MGGELMTHKPETRGMNGQMSLKVPVMFANEEGLLKALEYVVQHYGAGLFSLSLLEARPEQVARAVILLSEKYATHCHQEELWKSRSG